MLYGIVCKRFISSLLFFVCTSLVIGCAGPIPMTQPEQVHVVPTVTYTAPGITIDGTTKYQTIDGFGISEAFGEAGLLRSLPPTVQQQIFDDLFSTLSGAGLDILRNMIPSTSDTTIEPTNPRKPDSSPHLRLERRRSKPDLVIPIGKEELWHYPVIRQCLERPWVYEDQWLRG